jgi:hypothetical protein
MRQGQGFLYNSFQPTHYKRAKFLSGRASQNYFLFKINYRNNEEHFCMQFWNGLGEENISWPLKFNTKRSAFRMAATQSTDWFYKSFLISLAHASPAVYLHFRRQHTLGSSDGHVKQTRFTLRCALHATKALGRKGSIAPTHSQPRH